MPDLQYRSCSGKSSHEASRALRQLRGDGKPAAFVQAAVTIASSADTTRQLLQWVLGRMKPPRRWSAAHPLEVWLRMYRNHREMADGLGVGFGFPDDLSATELREGLLAVAQAPLEEVLAEVESMTCGSGLQRSSTGWRL